LEPAADRLRKLADDQMQDAASVNEAKRLLALIPGRNAMITPSRAEENMRHLNERATGFDTLGTKGAGAVFRETAGALRSSLVDAVHRAGFPEYAELRRAYGALVTIEDDVGRATGRELSRGSTIGLTEAIAVGETAMGSPTAGMATEGVKRLSQWLRSPNRAITKLFEEAASLKRDPSFGEKAGKALQRAPALAGGMPEGLMGIRDRIGALRAANPLPQQ